MYYICKPTKISIYVNSGRKSMSAVKRETGCDVIINGGLFDGKFCPCCWLKADGKILHSEAWHRMGYGWDVGKLIYDSSVNIAKYRNYIQCVELPYNLSEKPSYPAELGGKRARSAIGVMADGKVLVYCVSESNGKTPEQLQTEMHNLGCVSAVMLDGGGSSQCLTPTGAISSSRVVHNLICIWTQPVNEAPAPPEDGCPYPVPTRNLYYGCRGNDVRWLQWQLNRLGFRAGTIDGIFGSNTWKATYNYQKTWSRVPDGICGPKTRGHLLE